MERPPEGALVVTQVPAGANVQTPSRTVLDQRYPVGSRVVLVLPPFEAGNVRVLSKGLVAAGDPVVDPSGQRVVFVGKPSTAAGWQVYEGRWNGRRPTALTRMAGGAASPAIAAKATLVFSSPVPMLGSAEKEGAVPALYRQEKGCPPERLTYGTRNAEEPTVLGDGRVLFVAPRPLGTDQHVSRKGLFTVNNDGTEVTSFALDRDGAGFVRRPRELPSGRIAFLSASQPGAVELQIESVRTARPFASRTAALLPLGFACTAVEPGSDGNLLVCLKSETGVTSLPRAAVYSLTADKAAPPLLVFDDPMWDELEAVQVVPRGQPMGHISAMAPGRGTGTILCLDANFTRPGMAQCTSRQASRVRVIAAGGQTLGEMPLQADGSFLAEVPADTPFGLETLDSQGEVIHRLEPGIWVRPGENRSCIGCHEPPNRAPRNHRPLAIAAPPVQVGGPASTSGR